MVLVVVTCPGLVVLWVGAVSVIRNGVVHDQLHVPPVVVHGEDVVEGQEQEDHVDE